MSKAERLSPDGLRKLSEARNSALIFHCEHMHPFCSTTRQGACAEEAAELHHLSQHMAHTSQPAQKPEESAHAHRLPVNQPVAMRAPVSGPPQLSLF